MITYGSVALINISTNQPDLSTPMRSYFFSQKPAINQEVYIFSPFS